MPDRVYKYVTSDRLDILKKGLIRFTPPGAFNDLFEGRPAYGSWFTEKNIRKAVLRERQSGQESQSRTKRVPENEEAKTPKALLQKIVRQHLLKSPPPPLHRIVSFVQEATIVAKSIEHDFYNRNIGILSLSSVPDDILMWSHYAGEHSGFVIGFNARNDFFGSQPHDAFSRAGGLSKVNYCSDRPFYPTLVHSLEEVFVTKSDHWSYENEWRLFRRLFDADVVIEQPQFPVHLFKFPIDSIETVIAGAKTSDSFKKELRETVEGIGNIKLQLAVPSSRRFELLIMDINEKSPYFGSWSW